MRVSSKGRITLPVEIKKQLGIQKGTFLQLRVFDDLIELRKLPQLEGQPLLREFEWEGDQPIFNEESIQASFSSSIERKLRSPRKPNLNFRVFLDSTVLITAAIFESGSSSLFLKVCQLAVASTLVTRLVLQEVEENLQQAPFPNAIDRYRELIGDLDVEIVPIPFPRLQALDVSKNTFGVKESHVIAGVEAGRATHLITLDRQHFLQDKHQRTLFPIIACTPYQFMQDYFLKA